jgi:hypothetical protein
VSFIDPTLYATLYTPPFLSIQPVNWRIERNGGERGIRTLDTPCGRIRAFQARSFSHSDISPLICRGSLCETSAQRQRKSVVFLWLTDRTHGPWPSIRTPFTGVAANSSYRESLCETFARRKGKSVVFPFLTDRTHGLWLSIRTPFPGAVVINWRAQHDSNVRPSDPQSDALSS